MLGCLEAYEYDAREGAYAREGASVRSRMSTVAKSVLSNSTVC